MNSSQCGAPTGAGGRCTQPVVIAERCAAGHHPRTRPAASTATAPAAAAAATDPMAGTPRGGPLTADLVADGLDDAVAALEGSTNGTWVCDDYDLTVADCRKTLDALTPLDGKIGKDSVPTGLTGDALAGLTIRELVQQAHLNLTNAAQRARRTGFAEDRDGQERVAWERNRAKSFLTAVVIAGSAIAEGVRLNAMGGGPDGGGWTRRGELAAAASHALGRPATEDETGQWGSRLIGCGVTIRT